MVICMGRLGAGLSAILLFSACRTPAGSRLASATDGSVATATTTTPDCEQVAAAIHLSSTTTKAFCSGADPAGKAACMLAASEALTKPAGASVTPSPAIGTLSIAQLCAADAAAQKTEEAAAKAVDKVDEAADKAGDAVKSGAEKVDQAADKAVDSVKKN